MTIYIRIETDQDAQRLYTALQNARLRLTSCKLAYQADTELGQFAQIMFEGLSELYDRQLAAWCADTVSKLAGTYKLHSTDTPSGPLNFTSSVQLVRDCVVLLTEHKLTLVQRHFEYADKLYSDPALRLKHRVQYAELASSTMNAIIQLGTDIMSLTWLSLNMVEVE